MPAPAYADLKATVEQLRASPVPSGDVEQLRAAADQLRLKLDAAKDALDRIQMMSDGRLDQAIGVARQQLDEIRASLVVAKYSAAETPRSAGHPGGRRPRGPLAPVTEPARLAVRHRVTA